MPELDLHRELVFRRDRLRSFSGTLADEYLEELISEVDTALKRFDGGDYGCCEGCRGSVEKDRLETDPLTRYCLDCLSAKERSALERDLELASRVQEALLPEQDVSLLGWEIAYEYRPHSTVSGDYCDLSLPTKQGEAFRLFFGDISGKGVSASLSMARLNGILRSLGIQLLELGQLMAAANSAFCVGTLASSYATLIAGRFTADGEIELCNAGHCSPLLSRQGQVTAIGATGLPVGLFCSGQYSQWEATLEAGDRILLYTDGLSEARNTRGVEYGEQRIADVLAQCDELSARATLARCLQDLASFTAGEANSDDLTAMVIRRLEREGD